MIHRTKLAVGIVLANALVLTTGCPSVIEQADDGAGGADAVVSGPNAGPGANTVASTGAPASNSAAATKSAAATTNATTTVAASSVTLASASSGPPAPDDEIPPYFPQACPEALSWPVACMTVNGGQVVGFNAETGESCTIVDLDADVWPNSLALVGSTIVVCDQGAGNGTKLARIDALTGDVLHTMVDCEAVTDATDVLYVNRFTTSWEIVRATSFEDLVQGIITATNITPYASRVSARNADLYAAWHATNELQHWDIPTETELPIITLQDFDDWVVGIAPIDDGRILIMSWNELVIFSPTGERLGSIPWSSQLGGGLRCYTN